MPPRSVIMVVVAIIGILAGTIFLRAKTHFDQDNAFLLRQSVLPSQEHIASATATMDSDADGLADWEEVLWKSDPHNKDTDGDGEIDGDEVDAGRDPTVPGPGDLDTHLTTNSGGDFDDKEPNLTRTLGREMFSEYLSVRGSTEGPLGEEAVTSMVNSLANNVKLPTDLPAFSTSDIDIVSSNSNSALKSYGNAVGALSSRYAQQDITDNELTVFFEVINLKADISTLVKIDPYIESYNNFITEMVNIPVPESMSLRHLNTLNTFQRYASDLKSIRNIETDPVSALMAVQTIITDVENAYQSIVAMGKFFDERGVEFRVGDPGYVFTQLSS